MDTRLLKHYENELTYMRDMGAEFAAAYPKIAARLGMDGSEVADPYVERLLEGVAFLSARVQLELELQYPALTSHLLEIIYPHYLAPTPSMMIVAFEPDVRNTAVKDGFVLKRHTSLRSRLTEDAQTGCIYRTAADTTLWPIEISEVEYIDSRGALVAAGVGREVEARAAIRLRLSRTDGNPISALNMDRLSLFINGQEGNSWQLHELLCTQVTGIEGRSTDARADWTQFLREGRVVQKGFERDEALLPNPRRSFEGYRLLQEYFAMPERFHFVELQGILPALQKASAQDVDIYVLLKNGQSDIGPGLLPASFTLNAVPAINLFPKRFDRVRVTGKEAQHHLIANRTAGLDFEVYSIDSVAGISGKGEKDVDFRPFYSATDFTAAGETHPAYYLINRKMRQRSEREKLHGARTSYLGSETYLSLVDSRQAPYSSDLGQLEVSGLCTNRDLPLLIISGGKDVFHLPDGGPVLSITTMISPTRPRPTIAQGDTAWRLISHLSLNYLSIADGSDGDGAEALRELLGVYAPIGDRVLEKQLEGFATVKTRPIVRRMTDEVLSTAVRGLEISIGFDESHFEGTSVYLLGAVLERFVRKYVTINSFSETVLTTQQRGEIARWQPESGLGRMI